MRILNKNGVESGESGSVGVGLMHHLATTKENNESCQFERMIGLNSDSVVLCINTEGATDPVN